MPTQHRKRKHNRPLCPACEHTATKMGTTSSGKQRWRCTDCGHTFTNPNTAKTSAYRFAIFIDWITNQRPLDAVAAAHNVSRRTCVNATKPTHPTAGRKPTTPASTPTSTPPGPSDTAGQDAHSPSTTPHNPPIPTPEKAHILSLKSTRREKHTFCRLTRRVGGEYDHPNKKGRPSRR